MAATYAAMHSQDARDRRWAWKHKHVPGDDLIGRRALEVRSRSTYDSSINFLYGWPATNIPAAPRIRKCLDGDVARLCRNYGIAAIDGLYQAEHAEALRAARGLRPRGAVIAISAGSDAAAESRSMTVSPVSSPPRSPYNAPLPLPGTLAEEENSSSAADSSAVMSRSRSPTPCGEGPSARAKTPRSPSPHIVDVWAPDAAIAADVPNKLSLETLQAWFKDIDSNGSGYITQREFIVAIQHRIELLSLFDSMHENRGAGSTTQVRGKGVAPWAGASDVIHARRSEIRWIKEIFKSVDSDNSGIIEHEEFIDFFRTAGLLKE